MDLSTLSALILAGGLGTRLRSVVADRPKGLAPVAARPFLEYQIEWLAAQGIRHIVLCVGYRSQQIVEHLGDGERWGVQIRYSVEPEALGTGGALALARSHVSGTFLAMNGDTYYVDAVAPLLAAHQRTDALLTLAVSAAGARAASGQLEIDAAGRVRRFVEKSADGEGGWINAGLYMAEPELLAQIPSNQSVSLEREIIPHLLAAGQPVFAHPLPGGYIDMGTPTGFAQLNQLLADRS